MLRNNWLTGLLILSMPISLIYFLGSQMAYGQVQRRFDAYAQIPEYTALAELASHEANDVVMLRGQLVESVNSHADVSHSDVSHADVSHAEGPLLLYQERPLDGREVRYREEFKLIFPELALELTDGTIPIQPSEDAEQAISHETRRIAVDDREFTGFQAGDIISFQGNWQPARDTGSAPMLVDVTGISGVGKAVLLDDVQLALQKVSQARNALGLLTLVSILLLAVQLYHRKKNQLLVRSDTFDEAESNGSIDRGSTDTDPIDYTHTDDETRREGQKWQSRATESVQTI